MRKFYNSVNVSKTIENKKINVSIRLDDCCGNGVCDFAITCDIYEQNSRGMWENIKGGCCHDEILKYFPEFADFVSLHCSNVHGQPSYPVANGHYFLVNEGVEKCADYLRIGVETAQKLSEDMQLFKYQLFAFGIVDKWQKEAEAAIKHYEELKGEKWVNPYAESDENFVLRLTDAEREKVENLIKTGYYTPESIKERQDREREEKRERERNEIIERFDKKIKEAETDKAVYLCVLDTLGSTDNVIYYSHSNTLAFNWKDYGHRWTQAEFVDFCNSVDMSRLPDNINIVIE